MSKTIAELLTAERSAADLKGYFDGSAGTAEDYRKARKRTDKAARRLMSLIADLVDPEDCEFDHNGGCQAHGYLSLRQGEKCPHAEAKQLIAAAFAAATSSVVGPGE